MSSESLADLAERWLAWKNTAKPSPSTLRARRADLAVLGSILGGVAPVDDGDGGDLMRRALRPLTVDDLTPPAMADAFAAYAGDHAPASIRRCRSTWSGFCRWLMVNESKIDVDPVQFVEPPKAQRWRPKPVSEDDLVRIVRAAQTPSERSRRPWPELEQILCALFVGAGLRVSEAMGLRVGDVHRSASGEMTKLSVAGKGGVTRTVPVPPEVVTVVDRYLHSRKDRVGAYQPTDRLVVKATGKPLTPKTIDHLVLGWFRRAGVAPPKGALAHSLRHTYATLLVEQSGSVPEVQRLLGHADLATTQAYIDVAARGVEQTALANPARRMLDDT